MSLLEFERKADPESPTISVGMVVSEASAGWGPDEFTYKGLPSGILPESPPIHLFIDGEDKGALDWEVTASGEHGFIEGIDALSELKSQQIHKLALAIMIECLHDYNPKLETLDYPGGQEVYKIAA